jgi:16S rRNA (uracil1498-N3)-methyltransferase
VARFFAPKENVKGDCIHIEGQEARHILNVMRLKENDKVVVFDGTGKEYVGFIKTARGSADGAMKPRSLVVEIVSTKRPNLEVFPKITLVQSIPKKETMDLIVEKATELGVHAIVPITSERTVVKLEEGKSAERVSRWQRIAVEAAKQCGRTDLPGISQVQSFREVIDTVSDYDLALMACLSDDTIRIREALSDFETGSCIVFIGPEGDFSPDEIAAAHDTTCAFISLGPRVLKSDTAGLYALSVLHYEFSR